MSPLLKGERVVIKTEANTTLVLLPEGAALKE